MPALWVKAQKPLRHISQDWFSRWNATGHIRDGVVEGNVDLHSIGDKCLKSLELLELVLGLGVLGRRHDHAGHEGSEGGNSVTLA